MNIPYIFIAAPGYADTYLGHQGLSPDFIPVSHVPLPRVREFFSRLCAETGRDCDEEILDMVEDMAHSDGEIIWELPKWTPLEAVFATKRIVRVLQDMGVTP